LEDQPKKIMARSNQKFNVLVVGTTVRIPIHDVDRARGSPRNLLAVIVEVENDLYKLGN